MTVIDAVQQGPLYYQHHYMITAGGEETCDHVLNPPQALLTLADRCPAATIVEFGDATLGIEIDGGLWAAELPHAEMRPAKRLPDKVWQYLNLALGRDGDTRS